MQPKQQPAGVKVFGSAVLRVEPNTVSLQFTVSRQAQQPKEAFRETHQSVQRVRSYLNKAAIGDVAASRITLSHAFDYSSGKPRSAGYVAKVSLNVLLSDLDRMEEVLVGVIEAGANEVGSVEFRTNRLKEFRMEARRRAVEAAREKAENYCRAAGIVLGSVMHIEDVHPESLRGTGEQNTVTVAPSDEGDSERALAPGSIIVGAAVSMTFTIGGEHKDQR
jgi:uncharacterized protein YggE